MYCLWYQNFRVMGVCVEYGYISSGLACRHCCPWLPLLLLHHCVCVCYHSLPFPIKIEVSIPQVIVPSNAENASCATLFCSLNSESSLPGSMHHLGQQVANERFKPVNVAFLYLHSSWFTVTLRKFIWLSADIHWESRNAKQIWWDQYR